MKKKWMIQVNLMIKKLEQLGRIFIYDSFMKSRIAINSFLKSRIPLNDRPMATLWNTQIYESSFQSGSKFPERSKLNSRYIGRCILGNYLRVHATDGEQVPADIRRKIFTDKWSTLMTELLD